MLKPPHPLYALIRLEHQGDVVYADWKVERDNDTNKQKPVKFDNIFAGHFGPVTTISRSPFFPDIVLTVGGWSFSVWREGVSHGPLLSSPCTPSLMTAVIWSPTRPGVFYVARDDGCVDVWDLLDRSHEPSITQNVSSSAIKSMNACEVKNKKGALRVTANGILGPEQPGTSNSGNGGKNKEKIKELRHFLAVGDVSGTLHIIEIPRNLWRPSNNELSAIGSFFDREVRRLDYTTARMSNREKERQALGIPLGGAQTFDDAAGAGAGAAGAGDGAGGAGGAGGAAAAGGAKGADADQGDDAGEDGEDLDEEAEKEYRQFLEMERQFLEELGIAKDEDEDEEVA